MHFGVVDTMPTNGVNVSYNSYALAEHLGIAAGMELSQLAAENWRSSNGP